MNTIKNSLPLVSIVVCTRNEEKNIANCLHSIRLQTYPQEKIEIIVIDKESTDNTIEIAKKITDNVYSKGPNRAAQLNFGVDKSKGKFVFFPDADMILSEGVVKELVDKCENEIYDALYIPEKIIGNGFWIKVRDFERSFYNMTCIDAVRFVRKKKFLQVKGFDEYIEFGPDDWDFSRRIEKVGNLGIITNCIFHNEGDFKIINYLAKKRYYSRKFDKYINKWGKRDIIIKKQFGVNYRLFGVFIENRKWKRLLSHPLLALGMFFLRIMVGLQYLFVKVLEK